MGYRVAMIDRILGGVVTWPATRFVAKPLDRFFELRETISCALTFYANVSPELSTPQEIEGARTALRLHASELSAWVQSHRLLANVLRRLGYDPRGASSALIGFSNVLGHSDARVSGQLASHRDGVERALRFERSYPRGIKTRDS